MAMDLPIVVGVDGSEPGLRAVDWAADEAALRGAPLRLVYASLWERYEGARLAEDLGEPSERVRAEDIVDSAARRAHLRRPDVKITTDVLPEEPEYTLLRESRNASLLVTGTRGRSALTEALLGSVSLTVAAHAHCPMIVVRGSHDNRALPATHGRVVVGVGERPTSSAAVRFAFEEAGRRGAEVEAVRAWRCPAHETTDHPLLAGEPARLHEEQAVEALESALQDAPADVRLHRRTAEGHARNALVDASRDADLLIIGAKRRQRHFGLQLGRVTHGVLHHSACPVVIVPEQE
ncbi:universal stress protein [Streptomyces europaeiscabiei]|uniref:Universal stress protein n=1 Tax=Streptomyces europaeiscabiei TaxID=146819 RepID=A0ABU4NTX9_9ACTN|nr:universal stress protein [Streptomyces europaeiscabiei]MDX3548592.1 universal stress protein [Streptomyces europaeiscabiei]MDX3558236.1 universal stress protein [Streptomyces europaeiscabiei]MDX3672275.1 universal stress protein [Streptomyces europaeiscabiei]MDX3706065.1 universal stress protein [Streptomyces europaeiscabiei]MDX3867186.1 universal stress protein [Streptomyces europaeiscabiei]